MKIKFGILGCGFISKRHAEHITNHPDGQLIAGYDVDPAKAKALASSFNCSASDSLEEFLKTDMDIVNVCSPNGMHFQNAMDCLQAGKHVLVEKPMALTKDDCEQMINVALRNNRQLFVVKQNRYNPPIVAIKKMLEEGKLGKIYYVVVNCFWNRNERYYKESNWKGTKKLDGGTLFTQFSHFVDIMYYLFGDIKNIQGLIKNVNHRETIEFEDTGSFTFEFKQSGALGTFNYTTSCFEQNMEGSVTIFAEKATIKVGGKYLNALDYQKTEGFDIVDLPVSNKANDYGFYQGSMSNHDMVIDNVIKTLQGTQNIMTNAMEGLKSVEIIENVYNSVKWSPS